jgi:hypothetical protein
MRGVKAVKPNKGSVIIWRVPVQGMPNVHGVPLDPDEYQGVE